MTAAMSPSAPTTSPRKSAVLKRREASDSHEPVSPQSAPSASQNRQPKDRWTAKLVAGGWTPVSDFFLKTYSTMRPEITSLEAMFIVQLMSYKWGREAPWPGFKSLAKRMGVSTTSARGYARRLDRKGYLRREKRVGSPNRFHLEPLFEKLEKELQAKAKGETARRQKPRR